MRIVPILLSGVLVAGIASSALWSRDKTKRADETIATARNSLHTLQREVRLRGAMDDAELNGRGWPLSIQPEWFKEAPPANPFVPNDRPWLEIAASVEDELTDPPVRQSVDRDIPAFWYNPANGVVRARVGPAISDRAAIDLYNRINGSEIVELFDSAWDVEKVLLQRAAALKDEREQEEASDAIVIVRPSDDAPRIPDE